MKAPYVGGEKNKGRRGKWEGPRRERAYAQPCASNAACDVTAEVDTLVLSH